MGRATVYRTIKLLLEAGVICRLLKMDGARVYSLARAAHRHHHSVCVQCGEVGEFNAGSIDRALRSIGPDIPGEIVDHHIELYVTCLYVTCDQGSANGLGRVCPAGQDTSALDPKSDMAYRYATDHLEAKQTERESPLTRTGGNEEMILGLMKWRSVAMVAAIAALVFAIACGDDEPEPPPAVDTAKLIQDAVASAQSASAAEIQKSVAAAIAAQPEGLTRADVEAIVSQSTEGQLSAADVKAIVDESFRALPAPPEIDVAQLVTLVNSAVAEAVPEGVSAEEISRIVEAQVSAGLAGTLTRGDIEDLVAKAVEDAVGDQLTADQVTDIVNASLAATNEAIENAAAEAAQAAAAAEAAQAAAAASRETPTPSGPTVQVVTTTNFVADWVREVGGDRVEVFSLLPPGGDPHTFLPGPRDVARVADADLILNVGLGLEADWLEDLLRNASADESKIVALGDSVDPVEFAMLDMHDDHGDEEEDGHHEEGHDDHGGMAVGRLLVADRAEAHLSVIDLSTDDVGRGVFDVAAPRATVYPSPTHRYAIVLARGPEDDDDRIHVFDGGVFLVEHGDHYDLVTQPVSRHALEIAEERPIHYVNSHGWTAIFADAHGHVFLINEADLAGSDGDYQPIVFEAGPQHGAALVISDDHVVVTTKNPDYPETPTTACLLAWKSATSAMRSSTTPAIAHARACTVSPTMIMAPPSDAPAACSS